MLCIRSFLYYIDASFLLENTPLSYEVTSGTRGPGLRIFLIFTGEDIDDVFSGFSTVVFANSHFALIRKKIARLLEDTNFIFTCKKKTCFTHSLRSFAKCSFCDSKIKFIFSCLGVISSMYLALSIIIVNKTHLG